MRTVNCLIALGLACLASARSGQHVGKRDLDRVRSVPPSTSVSNRYEHPHMRRANPLKYYTPKTKKYYVDGAKIPDVNFDVGESYAGLMPISADKKETRQLYYWFFPTQDPNGQDDITIWLNGGPGCSSLEGFLQENGPFLWQYGTFKPVENPWAWNKLSNMIWVEQPAGTGFSQGVPNATSEKDVAAQFLGFFKQFIETFELYNKKIYITGESYAGYYVPYIADAMFNAKDTKYYDVQGTMIYDPSTSSDSIQEEVPAVAFVDYWAPLFNFNNTFMADIHARADKCGYTKYLNDNLVFPPKGPLPPAPDANAPGCDVFTDIFNAALLTNPCFDIYQIATTCPLLWDVLGFPGSFDYLPAGAEIYFNRSDVKRHINAPNINWMECTNKDVFVGGHDQSPPSGLSVLPGVIEKSKRTIIAHGLLDMVLIANGTLLMIQNMTWNGVQGFQQEPKDEFFVPYHEDGSLSTRAASGVMGTTHTERGLTWVTIQLSGHMVPQYAPSAAYRQMQYLLGRIPNLTQ